MKNNLEILIERILALPREEIEAHARIYSSRAEAVGVNCRNNVAQTISIKLYCYLSEESQRDMNIEQELKEKGSEI